MGAENALRDFISADLDVLLIGVYSLNANVAEISIMLVFGVLGFLLRRVGFEGAPFILAMCSDRSWKPRCANLY